MHFRGDSLDYPVAIRLTIPLEQKQSHRRKILVHPDRRLSKSISSTEVQPSSFLKTTPPSQTPFRNPSQVLKSQAFANSVGTEGGSSTGVESGDPPPTGGVTS
jgi:hypothetical protein